MKIPAMTILLIEDNPDHIFLTQQAISATWRDARLTITRDLVEVRALLHSPDRPDRFDLILVALDSRHTGRLAELREMQASSELSAAPIIALASSTRDQELAQVADQPVEWIILKPLRAESLREAMQRRPLPQVD